MLGKSKERRLQGTCHQPARGRPRWDPAHCRCPASVYLFTSCHALGQCHPREGSAPPRVAATGHTQLLSLKNAISATKELHHFIFLQCEWPPRGKQLLYGTEQLRGLPGTWHSHRLRPCFEDRPLLRLTALKNRRSRPKTGPLQPALPKSACGALNPRTWH